MYVAGVDAFLAIVQTHSLKKAADMLHLTQATISYRLKTLEQEMGATLVERSKGVQAISLTPFGESFVSIAERWNALKRETEILQASGPQLSLAVGGSNSLNTYVLPPLYRALSQHTPKLRLQFRTQHSVELYDTLERREVDVAFVKMERTVPNIVVKPFFVDEMMLIRPATPENSCLEAIHPSELNGDHEIHLNWSPSYQAWHDRWWDPFCPSRIPVDSAGLIFSLMLETRQWSVVPKSVADVFVKTGQFVTQRLLDAPPARICYKITHKYPTSMTNSGLAVLDKLLAVFLNGGGQH
jgi:DNA-binding transcriptional LysR family regulator